MRPVTLEGVALVMPLRVQQPAWGQHPAAALMLNETARFAFKMKVGALTNTAQASLGGSATADLQHASQAPYQTSTMADTSRATRNYLDLTMLASGSIHADNPTFRTL